MMTEIINKKQPESVLGRRWFSDDYFDLIIWENKNKEIKRFELCYNKFKNEHALAWSGETGYSHLKVDDGEQILGRHKMSPILIADGLFDSETLASKFLEAAKAIDQTVVSFIYNKINEYNAKSKKG